jgi:uncharacterized protein YktA (UPF0223 family)
MSFLDNVNSAFDKGFSPYKQAKDNLEYRIKNFKEFSEVKSAEKKVEDDLEK